MSRIKHSGQYGNSKNTMLDPQQSVINFIVPSKQYCASENFLPSENIKPGIIYPLLDNVALNGQLKSHKLCVDGKK